jgi:predicted transposase YbfD/YdcC
VAAVIRVERDVYTRNAKTGLLRHSAETAFYVSNTPVTAARAAEAIRAHWKIESVP